MAKATSEAQASETHLNMTPPFAKTLLTPSQSMGQATPGTTYLSTKTVTPPANPPASSAKPRKSTTLAFHATPEPE